MGQPCLEIRGLLHSYNAQPVVRIPHLKIDDGKTLVLLGPNGAGKSTLLRILALLEPPDSGEIIFRGEQVTNSSNLFQLRRRMAVVFQDPLLFSTTVWSNVAYGLKARRLSKLEIERRVKKALEKLGVSHLAKRSAKTLSGGEAQRVALARSLVLEPEVLFLDEPLVSLDAPSRERLKEDLHYIFRDSNFSVVYVTHERTEAIFMADRVAVMNQGQILQLGSVQEVFATPVTEQVASFVGVETILPGQVKSNLKGIAGISVNGKQIEAVSDLLVGREVLVCIRPEEVTVMEEEEAHSSARNHFSCSVTKLLNYGAQAKITLDCGFSLVALVTKKSVDELQIKPGRQLVASFKATGVHVISR